MTSIVDSSLAASNDILTNERSLLDLIPNDLLTPPYIVSYRPVGQNRTAVQLDATSPEFGRAVAFVGDVLRHVAHSFSTPQDFDSILHKIHRNTPLAKAGWKARVNAKALAANLDLEGQPQEHSTLEVDYKVLLAGPLVHDVEDYITETTHHIIFSRFDTKDATQCRGPNELLIPEGLARIFNETQNPAGNSRYDVSDETFTTVKLYTHVIFLSTILHELGHAMTKEFFGLADYVGNWGDVGLDVEESVLSFIPILEWPRDVFDKHGKTDEERLWGVTGLIGKRWVMSESRARHMSIGKQALQLLIDSVKSYCLATLSQPPPHQPDLPSASPYGVIRARLSDWGIWKIEDVDWDSMREPIWDRELMDRADNVVRRMMYNINIEA